jgi:hypothetical protein
MSIDGRWAPHPSPPRTSRPAALALLAPCGFCWAELMPPAIALLPHQREALAQALADAVCYRDPPVYCDACDALENMLCKQCAVPLARARASEMGVEVPV